jgi:hypothetical protein
MTNEASPARSGALTGALLGAVCRPVVVSAFWLLDKKSADPWITVLFTSCIIGLLLGWLAGWIAGSIRHPAVSLMIGAGVGAALAFVSSVVTLYFLCIATYGPRADVRGGVDVNVGLYLAIMALAGAIPGVGGCLVGNVVRRKQAAPSPVVHQGATDRPGDGPSDPAA